MNGFTIGQEGGIGPIHFIGQESYHPNALGHQLMANAILTKTNNLTQMMPLAKTNLGKPALDYRRPIAYECPTVWLHDKDSGVGSAHRGDPDIDQGWQIHFQHRQRIPQTKHAFQICHSLGPCYSCGGRC